MNDCTSYVRYACSHATWTAPTKSSLLSSLLLLVCYGGSKAEKPLSTQRLSHWPLKAIATAYEVMDCPASPGIQAHSTRGVATSVAILRGMEVEICRLHRSFANTQWMLRLPPSLTLSSDQLVGQCSGQVTWASPLSDFCWFVLRGFSCDKLFLCVSQCCGQDHLNRDQVMTKTRVHRD